MPDSITSANEHGFVYHILRYTSDLIRDEWVNIGVMLYDPLTGALRLRLVEEQDEYARIRRLQPAAHEDTLRGFRDHLEDQFVTFLRNMREDHGPLVHAGEELQRLVDQWNNTLSNGLQLAPQKGVLAYDLDLELERLYAHHVAPPRKVARVGAPSSRAALRNYCSQVWKMGGLWDRLEKSVRITDYTFPGDPMRLDYCYRKNGTRGFVQTLSVSRAPADCKLYAYTAARIAARAPFASEFAAITDVSLSPKDNDRHSFVDKTLRDAGIQPVPLDHFAVWVNELKPLLH
ncbi:MAG: hypothetical protein DMG35_05235 [Acidobacteria bacterium]|nr:MAG: hypothetical protein AUH86_24550 [Acidobacteria bacterium 13_1_40CM_4_58_4]PYT63103.1 MAG: hypothetical protein DMG35_05235 [Acidobacteriota bacterium]